MNWPSRNYVAPGLGVAVAAGDPMRLTADGFADALDLAARGVLTTSIAATFALAALPDAHRLSEGGHLRGKVVVQGP
ncbi:zinc-binding dehydrogenase [Arthrobacter sp. CP30]|nr:hypothetical protein ASF21_06485 [Arthrobacter sp. Leaf234]